VGLLRVSTCVAYTANSSWIPGPRIQARLPMAKARRSSTPSSQHQHVAAGLRVDLEAQLDQACRASGGEGRHDRQVPVGRISRLWL
jgi:hypothetical protein